MKKSDAMKIWEDVFGGALWAQDCFGTWMYKHDYGDTEKYRKRPGGSGKAYNYGWEIDHIMPRSSFDKEDNADNYNNYEPMHYVNNREKADKKEFVIRNHHYKIVSCDICKSNGKKGYGILDKDLNERVDWKYIRRSYYE